MEQTLSGAESLSRILQFAISPVVLISAVGLLLLTVTNRFGRAIDRSRKVVREIAEAPAADQPLLKEQLEILLKRCGWLQRSITLIAASLFLSGLMIFLMFLKIMAGWPVTGAIIGAFALNILSLIAAIVYFLMELFLALEALRIEVRTVLD
jgi:hypothetical protein